LFDFLKINHLIVKSRLKDGQNGFRTVCQNGSGRICVCSIKKQYVSLKKLAGESNKIIIVDEIQSPTIW